MKEAFPHQELQQGFAPFDLATWSTVDCSGALRKHLEPIAVARKVKVSTVEQQFFAVRPLAQTILETGVTNVDEYWSAASRQHNASTRFPELSIDTRPMMSQVVGTMELKQNLNPHNFTDI